MTEMVYIILSVLTASNVYLINYVFRLKNANDIFVNAHNEAVKSTQKVINDVYDENTILLYEIIQIKIKENIENENYREVANLKEALKGQRFKKIYNEEDLK